MRVAFRATCSNAWRGTEPLAKISGDPTVPHGSATLEGGDVMPIGNSAVLIGISERNSRPAITQVARALFDKGAATRVVVAAMPKLRAAMHLDTIFTFADRDVVCVYPEIVYKMHGITLRPSSKKPGGVEVTLEKKSFIEVVADALNLKKLRV